MSVTALKQRFELRPLSEHLGLEIVGLRLSADMTEDAFSVLHGALTQSPVVVLSGQTIGPEDMKAIGRRFGRLEPHSILQYRHPEHPDLSYITNVDKDGNVDTYGATKRAVDWHSDGSFKTNPDAVSFLVSVAAPSTGGPTEFTSMYRAYETLPDDLKRQADSHRAFHMRGEGWRIQSPPPPLTAEQKASGEFEGAEHPIALLHPWSKRHTLYINPGHTKNVVGLSKKDSDAVLDALYEHAINPAFQYHHQWQPGDVVFWDQRGVMHRAGAGTPSGERRIMLRSMVVCEPHHLN